ncbi:MAG: hypothetical protein HY716_13040 [Planctomycetes bacterium]|nr:hypothetical protein [Planctomycetota bacterium]
MVEFCVQCGGSLPKGDLTVRNREIFTSPDYVCPHCRKLANPKKVEAAEPPEPAPGKDLVFRQGKIIVE